MIRKSSWRGPWGLWKKASSPPPGRGTECQQGGDGGAVARQCLCLADVAPVFHRLKELAGSKWTAAGEIVLTARRFRTQEANRQDARERLADMLRDACNLPKSARSRASTAWARSSGCRARRSGARSRPGAAKSGWTEALARAASPCSENNRPVVWMEPGRCHAVSLRIQPIGAGPVAEARLDDRSRSW
jgi:hypothetical protein